MAVALATVIEPVPGVAQAGADAGGVHRFQFGVGHVAPDRHDAARHAVGVHERVDERAVVVAVAGRLHDHVAREAEEVAECEELLLRRVARRVFALRRVGENSPRTEHMTVRVHRARRRPERCHTDETR